MTVTGQQLVTPLGFDPTTREYIPFLVTPRKQDAVTLEEYGQQRISVLNKQLLYFHANSAEVAGIVTPNIDVTDLLHVSIYYNISAFTGGTTPGLQVAINTLMPDGIWYQIKADTNRTVTGQQFFSVGPNTGAQHALHTTIQIATVFSGAPTSITYSLTVVGE